MSSAHSPFRLLVLCLPAPAGEHCWGSVRPWRTDSCSGRPFGRPELLACPPLGGSALFPLFARWRIGGCVTALPVGIAGTFTHTSLAWLLPGRVTLGQGGLG